MKLLERLLVATDFSPRCEDALSMARETAQRFQSAVTLLHVLHDAPADPTLLDLRRQAALERLEQNLESLQSVGVSATIAVEVGAPDERIVRFADQQEVNAILMGANGAANGPDAGLGVVTERVLHRARKPVWIVKPGSKSTIARILCAVDYSDSSRRALANAIHLARQFEAELDVLHVVPSVAELAAQLAFAGDTPATLVPSDLSAEEATLTEFAGEHDLTGVTCRQFIRQGKPHQQILEAAHQMATDLLVMGTVGRSTLTRLLVGSVTTRVMRALPCSAIAVKAENLIRVHVEECVEDLKARFDQGVELLERGFLEQARQEFEHCLEQAPCYPPAWEQLAIVNEELGNHDEAERCRFHAHDILETMWNQRIEADLKSRIPKKKKPAEMA